MNYLGRTLAKIAGGVIASAVLVTTLSGSVTSKNQVYLMDNGQKHVCFTNTENAEDFLDEVNVKVGEFDRYTYTEKNEGIYELVIERAYPIWVNVDGERLRAMMLGETVATAIERAGITLGEEDIVSVPLDSLVEYGEEISIQRVTRQTAETTEAVPYETEYERTPLFQDGAKKTLRAGVNGEKVITSEQKLVDGEVVESKIISEEISKKPVTAQVMLGDKTAPVSQLEAPDWLKLDENGDPVSYEKLVTGKGTAYSARDGAKTASGRYAQVGYVAVDPAVIPYGSKLYIKSKDGSFIYGYAIAADTGTALLDGRVTVDLFFDTYEQSCWFGVKQMEVYVLD